MRRKRPEDDDTDAWTKFENIVLYRAFYGHIVSFVMRLEAWKSEDEIMQSMVEFCTRCDSVTKCDLVEAVPTAVPIVQKITVLHNALGLMLCLLPFWRLRFAHLIFYWWLVSEVLLIHKPFEYGANFGEHIAKTACIIWIVFYTSYSSNIIALYASFVTAQIVWPSYVISEDYEAGT